jgi:hypothetical protein
MTQRTNTVEYAFNERVSTLGPATRHDFAVQTLYIPETGSRVFDSVFVEITMTDAQAATASRGSVSSWLIGIKLGAVAFNDVTVTDTITDSGDQTSYVFKRDVTSYFTSNFGGASSQTAQVGFQYAQTAGTLLMTNITAKLVVTYRYEDTTSGTVRVKTVRIPLESNTGALTTSLASIGSNQIPLLDTFCPEGSKTFRQTWFEIQGNHAGNGTVDFQLGVALDAEAETLMGIYELANNSGVFAKHVWIKSFTTSATHDFKARVTATDGGTHACLAVVLCVTYEFDEATTTRVLNSVVLQADWAGPIPGTAATDRQRFRRGIFLSEPGTLTLKQSGMLIFGSAATPGTLSVIAGSQTARTYSPSRGSIAAGGLALAHRIDSGSGGSIGFTIGAAGAESVLTIDVYSGTNASISNAGGPVFLNYESDLATQGWGAHSHTVRRLLRATAADDTVETVTAIAPLVVGSTETEWWLTSIGFEIPHQLTSSAWSILLDAEVTTGEGFEDGWQMLGGDCGLGGNELGVFFGWFRSRQEFRRHLSDPDASRMSPVTTRRFRMFTSTTSWKSLECWATYHTHAFNVTGTVSGSSGGTVNLVLFDAADNEVLETGSRVGNGSYTIPWHDGRQVYVAARESGTALGRSDNGAGTRVV